jgi:hypothetical protein
MDMPSIYYTYTIIYPYAPWCWNIYRHVLAILGVKVGKYSSTMEHRKSYRVGLLRTIAIVRRRLAIELGEN